MQNKQHLYTFIYAINEIGLCRLECQELFGQVENEKMLFTNTVIEPSHSAFIKKRLDIYCKANNYNTLLGDIEKQNIFAEDFKVEYLILEGDNTNYADRLKKLKDIGYRIEGTPNYHNPTTSYAMCHYGNYWYFGQVLKNNYAWLKHKEKPQSFSNSINIKIAKALVNIAVKGNCKLNLLDACCGVGTVMLEACFAGINIEGCDINWKVCVKSRENLAYFNYSAPVLRSDIKDITKHYDAAIIDLPYNLFSRADENTFLHIITSAAQITNRLVIVSTADITFAIKNAGMKVTGHASVKKMGKTLFERHIWLCERI